jgi:hypothetical protein
MSPQLRPTGKRRMAFRRRVVRQYFVRFHMGLMVTASIAAALVSSKLLLEVGLTSVLVRYPLCVLAGYLVFVGLIRLWALYVLKAFRLSSFRVPDPRNVLDTVDLPGNSSGPAAPAFSGFHGGDSGGGGATDSWGSSLPGVDLDLNADLDDDAWIILILVLAVLVIFGAGVYVIWIAPQLLPDVALNLLLGPAVARAARRAESGNWFRHVLLYTCVPFVSILLLTSVLAFVVHRHCPEASKIAEAMNCPTTP